MRLTEPDIVNLFPTPVLSVDRTVTEQEKSHVLNLYNDSYVFKNEGNSWGPNNKVLDCPEFSQMKHDLEELVNDYVQFVYRPNQKDLRFYITISWLNYNKKKEYHHQHSHGNSIFSGVYYVDSTEDDTISFVNPNKSTTCNPSNIDIMPEESTYWNSLHWWLPTPQNRLLLFPSPLEHLVMPNQNDHVRKSIAFNTFFKGTIGDVFKLTELKL